MRLSLKAHWSVTLIRIMVAHLIVILPDFCAFCGHGKVRSNQLFLDHPLRRNTKHLLLELVKLGDYVLF